MPTPSLKECTELVPVCSQTVTLATVLDIFYSSGCDAIVVVSEQQLPLGVINLKQVLPHLLSRARSQENLESITTGYGDEPLSEIAPPVIKPLTILPASLRVSQFLTYLDREMVNPEQQPGFCSCLEPQQWAVVEEDGKFLGLLNSWLTLKSLASNSRITKPDHTQNLKLLIQLLEYLPLPLSLQTPTGQVLAENLSWCQMLGQTTDLEDNYTTSQLKQQAMPRVTTDQVDHGDCGSASINNSNFSTARDREPGGSLGEEIRAYASRMEITVTNLDHGNQRSPSVVGNGITQPYEPAALTTVGCYCTMEDTTRLIPPAQHQSSAIAITTPDQYSEIPKKNPERLFSLTKIPLSPSLLSESRWDKVEETAAPSTNSHSLSPNSNLWLVLAQDTTEQKQVAQELVAKNADLVHLNRLKDEFLACISHELKTPLTAVLGLSTLLKDQALGELNERQCRYARLIYQSGRQLMLLVNDILDLTRIETGQLELTLEPMPIQMVCDRAYAQALQVYLDKDQHNEGFPPEIPFTLEIEPGLETIIADELRLRQMLVHLLANALKFTDSNGEIGLKVSRLEGWIAFNVWDTGIGIPAEKQHLIFQKFQQLEEPLTRRFEGTGLGLVLTQRLARLHGGDVSFISKSGEGSEFTLLLPPCPPQRRGCPDLSDWGREPIRNRLILIVETVVPYLENLTAQLKTLGYWVVIARSGTEAIEKARSLQPYAILLNPLLPQLSGWDVLTLLKSELQTRHIPVLIAATQAEKAQAYAHNADGVLSLPVQKSALLDQLSRLGKHHAKSNRTLTILYLSSSLEETFPDSSKLIAQLTEVLNIHHSELNYQVLEAEDLEQAELLAQVWHPDVVLLEGVGITDPLAYLKTLAMYKGLSSVPLITLDRQISQAANQVIGLSVYPCLADDDEHKITALLDVIKVAAGVSTKSSILVMEIDQENPNKKISQFPISNPLNSYSPWLQALIQYLQTAGFRSLISDSWTDVYCQLQERNVDLLVIRLKDISNLAELIKGLIGLGELPKLPPILVLDHRLEVSSLAEAIPCSSEYEAELESQLRAVATQILQGHSYSMSELLDHIHQALAMGISKA